jgi:hypothetical protein
LLVFPVHRWNPAAAIALTAKREPRETQTAREGKQGAIAMPKANDMEGAQDQGGKHGGQRGMPKPVPRPPHRPDQGIVRDEKGQEQPRDKERAQQAAKTNTVRQ